MHRLHILVLNFSAPNQSPEGAYLRVRQARILEAMEASDVCFRCWGHFQFKESPIGAMLKFLDVEAQSFDFGAQVLQRLGFRLFGLRCWVLGLGHSFKFGCFRGMFTFGQPKSNCQTCTVNLVSHLHLCFVGLVTILNAKPEEPPTLTALGSCRSKIGVGNTQCKLAGFNAGQECGGTECGKESLGCKHISHNRHSANGANIQPRPVDGKNTIGPQDDKDMIRGCRTMTGRWLSGGQMGGR